MIAHSETEMPELSEEEKARRRDFAALLEELRDGCPNDKFLFSPDRWKKTLQAYWAHLRMFDDRILTRAVNRWERDNPGDWPSRSHLVVLCKAELKAQPGRDRKPIIQEQPKLPDENPLEQAAQRYERGEVNGPGEIIRELERVFPGVGRLASGKVPYTPNEGDWCEKCGMPWGSGHNTIRACDAEPPAGWVDRSLSYDQG